MRTISLAIRFGSLLLIILLGWRAVGSGLADYYIAQDWPLARMKALDWREHQPQALLFQAGFQSIYNPVVAEQTLQRAAWANPTDALVYLKLAAVWAAAGSQAATVRLAEIADILGPMRSPVLAQSVAFWRKQNRIDLMLRQQSMLVNNQPGLSARIFPEWLRLAEDSTTRPLLAALLMSSPEWGSQFFSYVANNAQKTETVNLLYQSRWRDGNPPSAADLKVYLDRLWRDQNWPEAYRVWRDGLDEASREALDNDGIYNGRFELPLSGLGFDWRVTPVRGVTVETTETFGVRTSKSLHLLFDGQRVRFQHLSQYLYLEPDKYQLRGRVRTDNLRTERGLVWTVRCSGGKAQRIADSERFFGADDWRTFEVDFTVPEADCRTQMLRLELEGRAELDFQIEGGIWFDDLTVTRLE